MKKIIDWNGIEDPTFVERLFERLSFFVGPIKHKKESDLTKKEEIEIFKSYSVIKRSNIVLDSFSEMMKQKKFWIIPLSEVKRELSGELFPLIGILGVKKIDRTCILCVVLAGESITKKQIKITIDRIPGYGLISDDSINDYQTIFFFVPLRRYQYRD